MTGLTGHINIRPSRIKAGTLDVVILLQVH